MPEQQDGLI